MMGLGLIWMLLFWGAFVLAAVWLIMRLFPTSPQPSPGSASDARGTARDILDQRYAQGELSRSQYNEMRQTIGR